jgi:hypothetical protein
MVSGRGWSAAPVAVDITGFDDYTTEVSVKTLLCSVAQCKL